MVGMSETNLTQRSTSTDVYASEIFSPRNTKKIFKKKGDLLRTTSYYSNSNCVRKLINIIMASVRTAPATKALKCES